MPTLDDALADRVLAAITRRLQAARSWPAHEDDAAMPADTMTDVAGTRTHDVRRSAPRDHASRVRNRTRHHTKKAPKPVVRAITGMVSVIIGRSSSRTTVRGGRGWY